MLRFSLGCALVVALFASFASAQVATGQPPFSSVTGGPDLINPGNLNVHWDFPFYRRTGRGMAFSYVMSYDSSVWSPVTLGSTTSWQPAPNFGWRGQSEAMTGFIHFQTSILKCRGPSNPDGTFSWYSYPMYIFSGFQDAVGTFHPITVATVDGSNTSNCTSPVDSISSGSGAASDGSGYSLSVSRFTDATITTRGGITIHAPTAQNGSGSITDTNGNVLTTTANTQTNITTFTDTLGTTALTVSGLPPLVTYTYTDPSGQPAVIKVNYTTFTVATSFGVSGISEYPPTATSLVTSIVLPNGTSYGFTYEPTPSSPAAGACSGCVTGRIASVTLPSGGVISYAYTGGNNGVAADGATSGFDRTTPDGIWRYVRNAALTTVTDPQGNETMYEFWSGIYESTRRYFQGKGSDGTGTLLAEIDTCWNNSCTAGSVTLPITQRSVFFSYPDGTKSGTFTFFNSLGLPTETDEYNFPSASSPPARKTLITYQSGLGNIQDRPHQVTVEDGANPANIASQTTYSYDESAYCCTAPTGTTPQHVLVSGSRGNPTTITSQASGSVSISKHVSYYDTGVIKSTYDARGNIVTTANFPDAASTCGNAFPSSVTAAAGLATSTTWNCSCGLPVSATDANNQLTQFQYDSMYRLTQVTRPDLTQLKTQFKDTLPQSVTQTTTANSAVTVSNLDTLGRVTTKVLQNAGTAISTVAVQYDSLGRPFKTSNPYAPGETPVFTTTQFDALGRPTSVAPATGGAAQFSYFDNSVTVKDPAGKQRRSYTDALGHLIQVDEPAPGQTTAGTPGTAIINITGAEQVNTTSGTKATGWFTVSGSDEWVLDCPPDFECSPRFSPKLWDSGEVSVTINGAQAGAGYGQSSSASALASSLANQLSPHPMTYSDAGNGTITVTADTPGPDYSLSASASSNDPNDFGAGSFSAAVSGPFLTGGVYPVTTYDSGTVTVNIGSFQAHTGYNRTFSTTASDLANALAAQINGAASPVTATVNTISSTQVQLLLTAKAVGTLSNLSVTTSANTASYQFSVTTSAGTATSTMTGGANPQSTLYAYSLLNNLTQISQGAQTRTYGYDQLGRLTSAATPESGPVTYSYLNSAGQPCSGDPSAVCYTVDARGVTTTSTYSDPLSRLTQVDYNPGASGVPATPSVSYVYGTSPAANNNGRLLTMTDGLGSETYGYDALGRVTQVSRAVNGTTGPFNIGYGYNGADQLTQITYPSGRIVQQNYDVLGRLGSIQSGGATYLSVPANGYNSAQMPLALNYGSGVAGAFQYNDHQQMSSLSYSLSGSTLLNLSYNYLDASGHNNGQIQGITDSRGDAWSTLFTYDALGRLIQGQTKDLTAASTWNLLWNYDIYGNRVSQSAGTPPGTLTTGAPQLSIDPLTNRIQMTGFSYDAAGNLVHDPLHSYTYNAEGELTGVDGTMSYAYDGHRWRMEKTVSGSTTMYIYSGSKVLAEYAAGAAPNAPSKEYVYSGGALLATVAGTSITYHYPDHLSNRFETNSAGTVTRTFGHLPFGETWYETGAADKWKFTGYERDIAESGLDYAMNRMYISGYGRFQTADLLAGSPGDPQSLNRFAYTGNDPLNFIDPSGLQQHPVAYVPPDPDLRFYEFGLLQLFFNQVDAGFQSAGSSGVYVQIDTPGVCNDSVCVASVTGHWFYPMPDLPDPSSFLDSFSPSQPATPDDFSWLGAFAKSLFSWKNFTDEFKQGGCVHVFGSATAAALNPFSPSLSSGGEATAAVLAASKYNAAVQYAASAPNYLGGTGLIYPMKSSVVRSMVADANATAAEAPLFAVDGALLQGVIAEGVSMANGECH